MRIWIDTDIGSDVDDALAIAYVMRHPGFELCGVSTVFGDVPLRTRIAAAVLDAGDASSVPLLPGLGVPLTPRRRGVMFGFEGKGLFVDADPVLRVASEEGGDARIEAIAETLAVAAPDVVLAIGPLTNIGALIRAGVDLPPLAIMGGKLDDVMVEGMSDDIFEWNWFCDSDAAQIVIGADHAELPLVVPGEVTFQTRLDEGDVELLAAGDGLCRMLAVQCQGWLDAQRDLFNREAPYTALHDPLSAAVLVEPDLCSFGDRHIAFDPDGTSQAIPGPPNARVATSVNAAATRDHIMETLLV